MAYHYDTVKLEKGMYAESGRSFTQVLEAADPSEQYRGTALEGMDAYQRQLKRFDIKVSGQGSDRVEKFFATSSSAALFPEYVRRAVTAGTGESSPSLRAPPALRPWNAEKFTSEICLSREACSPSESSS